MSLSSYLASKYLNADPSSSSGSKKRKRKTKDSSAPTGLIIADDDDMGWSASAQTNEDDGPLTISSSSAEFRKSKKSTWKTIGAPAPTNSTLDDSSAAADAIIALAAAENDAAAHLDEEPAIEDDDGIVKMGDGTHAGLQTAAAVSAQMEKAARAERRRWEAEEKLAGKSGKGKGKAEDTVYRDATGRRIDISMRRAEARAEAEAALRKEREEKEAQLGDVQVAAKKAQREALEEAKFMPLARGVDDEVMNQELRERERWDDPMMAFLTPKEKAGGGKGAVGTSGGGGGGKAVYKGAAAPNRYGIRPGHRWDGVDRGNGWEGERFREINRGKRNKELDFAWQMDE